MNALAIKGALANSGMKLVLHSEPEELLELLGNCSLDPPPTEYVTDRTAFKFITYGDLTGQPYVWGWDQTLAAVRREGFHGFVCNRKGTTGHNGEIHAWIGPNCPPETVIAFLAHEVGHYHGEPCSDPHAEEERADLFGLVAILAYRFFQQTKEEAK